MASLAVRNRCRLSKIIWSLAVMCMHVQLCPCVQQEVLLRILFVPFAGGVAMFKSDYESKRQSILYGKKNGTIF